MDAMRREQIAAQIVAIMQADFSRPGPQEMKQILESAESQITAQTLGAVPSSRVSQSGSGRLAILHPRSSPD